MRDWKNAIQDEIVCYCKNVTKREVLQALTNGARTSKEISDKTGAGTGNECASKNPTGVCCHADIQAILDVYLPAYEMMSKSNCCCCCGEEPA